MNKVAVFFFFLSVFPLLALAGGDAKLTATNSVAVGNVAASPRLLYGYEFCGVTNYIRLQNSLIDCECEVYVLELEIRAYVIVNHEIQLPRDFKFPPSDDFVLKLMKNISSNIASFVSSEGDLDDRKNFFARLVEQLVAYQAQITRYKEPIHGLTVPQDTTKIKKSDEVVADEKADEPAAAERRNPNQYERARIARESLRDSEVFRLQRHCRKLFDEELMKVLKAGKKQTKLGE